MFAEGKLLILALPRVVLSCILLLAAMVSSSRQRTAAWKSNSLATLFHGVGSGDSDDSIAHILHAKQMEIAAEGIFV